MNTKTRLAIRGFADGKVMFEDLVEAEGQWLKNVLPALAIKHAAALVAHEMHMIEIEFLDEPNPLERYFRFGTDPGGMVIPIEVKL